MDTYKLTDEDIDNISNVMKENHEKSESLRLISNLPSNNDILETKSNEKGEVKIAEVKIDPITGEKAVVCIVGDPNKNEKTLKEVFEDMGKAAESISLEENFEITPDAFKDVLKEDDTFDIDYQLSDVSILQMIELVNKYRNGGKIKYKDIPLEARTEYFDKLLSQNGISANNYSKDANSIRNELAEMIISHFETNLTMNKFMEDYNKEMENIFTGIGDQVSTYIKNYDTEKTKYLEEICKNITDDSKKEKMEQVLDSIYDGYKLSRMIGFRTRIKHFDLEKPNRVFNIIMEKYETESKYNIFNLYQTTHILSRHLTKNGYNDFGLKFMITFCRFCQNYNPSNPAEHGFIYYVLYNIILLDVYHNKEYEDFAYDFLANIAEVMGENKLDK